MTSQVLNKPFFDRVAFVTGGTRGIGRAVTLALAQLGASLAVSYLENEEEASELEHDLHALDVKHLVVKADVRDFEEMKRTMERVEQRLGKIHFLINNAGIARDRSFKKMEESSWHEVIATNLTGVFNSTKAAMNHMLLNQDARVIMISSIVGEMGNFGQVNYSAAKAGLLGLTKSLARELALYRTTVNAIAPGFTDTLMYRALSPEIQSQIIQNIPLKRVAQPEEIAHVATFLCSPMAGFITGAVMDVNGGMYM